MLRGKAAQTSRAAPAIGCAAQFLFAPALSQQVASKFVVFFPRF
jgi:hypothetical protein